MIKNILIYITAFFLSSCTILNRQKKTMRLNGAVTVTDYNIGVPCHLYFYTGKDEVANAKTESSGKFSLEIDKKNWGKELKIITVPLKSVVFIDTIQDGNVPLRVLAKEIKNDTLLVTPKNTKIDIKLNNFELLEISAIQSH